MKSIQKKYLMIGGGVLILVLLIVGGVVAWKSKSQPATQTVETTTKKRIVEPVNIIPVADAPVVYISPNPDGKNIEIVIESLKKPATQAEFELEYTTENLVQGAQGIIELATLPARNKLLLGSCSAGGACSYHTNVTGGSLKTRFIGAENYALKNDWRYFENKAKEKTISSKDLKFQMTADELAKQTHVVITNSPGYPAGLQGTPVSDPYAFMTTGTMTGKGKLTIRTKEDGANAVMGWDGKTWKEFTGKADGKSITADVDMMELYIAVTK